MFGFILELFTVPNPVLEHLQCLHPSVSNREINIIQTITAFCHFFMFLYIGIG